MHSAVANYGFIQLRERMLLENSPLPRSDVFVFCRSWEERSVHALRRVDGSPMIIQVVFEGNPAPDVWEPESESILDRARKEGRLIEIRLASSTRVQANCLQLRRELEPHVSGSMLIDISSIPKAYSLSTIGWILGEGRSPSVSMVYAEGSYKQLVPTGADPVIEAKSGKFTTGGWKLVQIPFVEGSGGVEEGQKLIALCGGDHDAIIASLQQYEHLRSWALLTSSTGSKPDSTAKKYSTSLERGSGIPAERIRYADPLSAVAALEAIRSVLNDRGAEEAEGALILPFSTKPHSVAAAVVGLFQRQVTILARQPGSYLGHNIGTTERCILITLSDLSSPGAAAYLAIEG